MIQTYTNLLSAPLSRLLFAISLVAFLGTQSKAQSGNCPNVTPLFHVDLTAAPDSTWSTPPGVIRDGQCCPASNAPNPNCVEFMVLLSPDAVGVSVGICVGANPGGSGYYQVECGPQISFGQPYCLSPSPLPISVTACKPGQNPNQYCLSSLPGISSPEDNTVRQGCDSPVSILGVIEESTVWSDITSGNGSYDQYLSCTTGCSTTIFSAPENGPAFIDYQVCGSPASVADCQEVITLCDTVRISLTPPLTVDIEAEVLDPCEDFFSTLLLGIPSFPDTTGYMYIWTDGPNGTGNPIGYDPELMVSQGGTYSLSIRDTALLNCGWDTTNITIGPVESPTAAIGAPGVLTCIDSPIVLDGSLSQGNFPLSYHWTGPLGGIQGPNDEDEVSIVLAGVYQLVVTDLIHGCTNATNVTVLGDYSTPELQTMVISTLR